VRLGRESKAGTYPGGIQCCGWIGSDTRHRRDATVEGHRHEEGIRESWVLAPGERSGWDGDPRSLPAD
jgi:hypothetical protein